MERPKSIDLFDRAKRSLVGGVNSPVRAFKSVGGDPVFFAKAKGARLTDVDGNSYLDYVGSWGPMILGHAQKDVVARVREVAGLGMSFGAPSPLEIELAERVCERVPSVERVRLVSSGTEATMSALRVARGFTGRAKVLKFTGCYHGHGDAFLIKAGSGGATFGVPDSAGVPEGAAQDTLTARFNDMDDVLDVFVANRGEIAAVIVEPVAGNMGVVPPADGFLAGLRQITAKEGALLIFDEVMTGFRVAAGGAQERFAIKPDLTCMGKVIGGGMPVGAYGGRREIMEKVSPLGPVYQAGTLSGNPVAMAAGIETLRRLTFDVYNRLEESSARLEAGLNEAIARSGQTACVQRVGSMLTLFFHAGPVANFDDAGASDTDRFGRFFRGMLDAGVYLPPSQFEAWFVSAAHSEADIDRTIETAKEVLSGLEV